MYNRGGVSPARRDWVTVNRRLNVIRLFYIKNWLLFST